MTMEPTPDPIAGPRGGQGAGEARHPEAEATPPADIAALRRRLRRLLVAVAGGALALIPLLYVVG